MKYLKINNNLFVENRIKFKNRLKKNTLAIFNSNDVIEHHPDGTIFNQNSDLFWAMLESIKKKSLLVVFR